MAKKEFDRISWAIVVVVLHTFFATVVTAGIPVRMVSL